MLAIIAKQLRELREVNIQPKYFGNDLRIEIESVGGQLDLLSKAFIQISNEQAGIVHGALADRIGRDQFSVRIQRNENPLIAYFRAVFFANLALLLANERPDFIALYIAAVEIAQLRVHQLLASLASDLEQPHDRVAIQVSEPFSGTNGAALKQTLDRTQCRIGTRKHRIASQFAVGLGESGVAGSAAPTLNTALTKVTSFPAFSVLASNACHIGLEFLAGQADNEFASALRLTPRADLAPESVAADAGAFFRLVDAARFGRASRSFADRRSTS